MDTKKIPNENTLDSTRAILRDGYTFIRNRCLKHNSDVFKTRLMGMPVVCMTGLEAVSVFYDNNHFIRKGATPKRVQKTLFGEKGVQTLDDLNHRKRKEMFMALMNPERLKLINKLTETQWSQAASKWENKDEIILQEESQKILCKVACDWAGVPIDDTEISSKASEFANMIDAFGGTGIRFRKGKKSRHHTEKWITDLMVRIREQKIKVNTGTAAHLFATQLENGKLLPPEVAAVELINIVRPIVAISWYITFAALAMHQYPVCRKNLQLGDDKYAEWFVDEVRRFYPFAPFIGARVRETFDWKGFKFPKNELVLLDIYGIQHDPRIWEKPEEFWPERFRNHDTTPFDFIPQGGGDYYTGHRCAGEWITIEVLKASVKFLAQQLIYEVPEQDLTIDLSRMPTLPKSHFIIRKIKKRQKTAEMA